MFLHRSALRIVLLEQVTLPVPFTVGKHFGQTDLFKVLDAFLQILLQHLPLLLLLVLPRRRPAVLLGGGARQRPEVERGGALGAVGGRWRRRQGGAGGGRRFE